MTGYHFDMPLPKPLFQDNAISKINYNYYQIRYQ